MVQVLHSPVLQFVHPASCFSFLTPPCCVLSCPPPPKKGWKNGVGDRPHIPLTTSLCVFTNLEGQPEAQVHQASEVERGGCSWNGEFCPEPAQIVPFLCGGGFIFHCAGVTLLVFLWSCPGTPIQHVKHHLPLLRNHSAPSAWITFFVRAAPQLSFFQTEPVAPCPDAVADQVRSE